MIKLQGDSEMATPIRSCKDCGSTTRVLKYQGPRCATCHRARVKAHKAQLNDSRGQKTYGLPEGGYDAIKKAQGGTCYICQRAKGLTKALCVDHDHKCCPGPGSCGKCVRGLLCSFCNTVIGRLKDDPEAFERAAEYLRRPPAHEVLLRF